MSRNQYGQGNGRPRQQGQGLLGHGPGQMSAGMKRLMGGGGGGLLGNAPDERMTGQGMVHQQARSLMDLGAERQRLHEGFDYDREGTRRGLLAEPEPRVSSFRSHEYDKYDRREPERREAFAEPDRRLAYRDVQDTRRDLQPMTDVYSRAREGGMHHQDKRRGLLEEPRSLLEMQDGRRGLLEEPVRSLDQPDLRQRGMHEQRMVEQMDVRREHVEDWHMKSHGDGLLEPPDRRGLMGHGGDHKRGKFNKQSDIFEKADLQIRLLKEEQMKAEATKMLLLQEERQRKEMLERQMAEQMLQQQALRMNDGLLGSGPGMVPQRQGGGGVIPSIFEVPTVGAKSLLGKRTGGPGGGRQMDNKRQRQWPQARRGQSDRRPGFRDNRNKNDRRSGDQKNPRRSRFDSPSASKTAQDKIESSGSVRSGMSVKKEAGENGSEVKLERSSKSGDTLDLDNRTEITVSVNDQYDPAEPTEDPEEKGTEAAVKEEVNDGEEKDKNEDPEDVEKGDGEVKKSKEISLTVTVNKKGRSVNDSDKAADEDKQTKQKKYKCNVCSVDCYDEESFFRHMNGVKHKKKMGVVMSVPPQSIALLNKRKQAEEHLRQIEAKRKPASGPGKPLAEGKALESHCKTCDKKFTGAFKDHKQTEEHQEHEARRQAGCKLCNVSTFYSIAAYTAHLQSASHRKKAQLASWPECKICDQKFKSPRKFVQHCKTSHHIQNKLKQQDSEQDFDELEVLVTLDSVGFDEESMLDKSGSDGTDHPENIDQREDSNQPKSYSQTDSNDQSEIEIVCSPKGREDDNVPSQPVTPLASNSMTTSTPKTVVKAMKMDAITPVRAEDAEALPDKYDPEVAVGQKFVVPVSGFFCKLCHKFYNNETSAKVLHCQSQTHFEKYKKTLELKQKKSVDGRKTEQATTEDADQDQLEESQAREDMTDEEKGMETNEVNGTAGKMEAETTEVDDSLQYKTASESQDSTLNASEQTEDKELDLSEIPFGDSLVDNKSTLEIESIQDMSKGDNIRGAKQPQKARRGGRTQRARRGRRN